MSSGNSFERLWKLQASANQLVLEGKRDPEAFADLLQFFVFGNILPDIDWRKAYKVLGVEAEYAEALKTLVVGDDPNLWFVPVVRGVNCNMVVAVLRKLSVNTRLYVDDLDKDVTINDRDPNKDGSYAVNFSRTIEADGQNKNLSADALKDKGHKGITLLERLLLELGYFLTAGQHLDVKNITMCSGSRCSGGGVPSAFWDSDRFRVGWFSSGGCFNHLRSRSAVSCQPKPERA